MAIHPHLERLIAEALTLGRARIAVAYPLSAGALEAAIAVRRLGLADPILVGPRTRIEEIAREKSLDLASVGARKPPTIPKPPP